MNDVAPASPGVASPCTSVCTMDPASGFCAGCARTLDEIASWSRYSDDEKRAVLARIASRRAMLAEPR
jgi:predicted Fe-S protein YdhL (DUF1289 family)